MSSPGGNINTTISPECGSASTGADSSGGTLIVPLHGGGRAARRRKSPSPSWGGGSKLLSMASKLKTECESKMTAHARKGPGTYDAMRKSLLAFYELGKAYTRRSINSCEGKSDEWKQHAMDCNMAHLNKHYETLISSLKDRTAYTNDKPDTRAGPSSYLSPEALEHWSQFCMTFPLDVDLVKLGLVRPEGPQPPTEPGPSSA